MKKNKDLKKIYNKIFTKGNRKHFTKYEENKGLPSDESEAIKEINWRGKKVLDVGCGNGDFVYEAARRGAQVLGIDYSAEAIKLAKQNYQHPMLEFKKMNVKNVKGKFDVIVSLGTLEHMDKPFDTLKLLKQHLKPKGSMIMTCPNWINPRGYILMTLLHLFDAPITLADIHYLSPADFTDWARKLKMKLKWHTFDYDRAYGKDLLEDFKKRIPNVLRDAKLPNKRKNIDSLLAWLGNNILHYKYKTKYSGATGLYYLKKN